MFFMTTVTAQSVNVSAQDVMHSANEELVLYSDFTRTATATCSISNGQVTGNARVIGYPGITTKIEIQMILQKENLWGLWWSDEANWSAIYYKDEALMSRQQKVSSGTYRIKVVYTVYSGNQSETLEMYSHNVSY